jgi:hypothetical protein
MIGATLETNPKSSPAVRNNPSGLTTGFNQELNQIGMRKLQGGQGSESDLPAVISAHIPQE